MALGPKNPKPESNKPAERDAAQQDVFLREVDDALRQDEMLSLFQRYGKLVGVVVAAGLLGLAGYLWWGHSQQQTAGERGEEIVKALDRIEANHPDSAQKLLAPVAKDGGPGSGTTAKLLQAGIALQQNRNGEAAKLFAEVAEDQDAPKPLRDLALVRQVSIGFDAMTPQAVVDKLKPLAVPGNPWFGSAGELVGIAWLKQNKPELAGPLFASIARDKEVPETLRRRARQMAGLLGVDAVDDVAKAAAGDAPEGAAEPDSGPAM